MFQEWVYIHWRVPGTDWTVYEGVVSQTLISLCQITTVFVALTFLALAWQRISNRIDHERRRHGDED